ncbi:MAG: hypothetical protein MUE31_02690 [Candidatus Nanopelagicales bacterium]|jgi:hypothetical protein|nr:hypothetical protein [Candidatus Nanopelagicales bacterium]
MNVVAPVRILAIALAIVSGLATGALAGSAESPWDRFASYGNGSGQRCGQHGAAVYTPPSVINAYGRVRYKAGDPCDPENAPAAYLAVREYLANGNGQVCAERTWVYNSQTAAAMHVPTNEGYGNCPNWNSLRGVALGRMWNNNSNQYMTADDWILSPYQN